MRHRRPSTVLLLAAATASLAAGCASGPHAFSWTEYEDRTCRWLREGGDPAGEARWLTDTIAATEKAKREVPAGVRAHAGFLWSLAGDTGEASGFYGREKEAYPESAVLMDALLARLGR